MIKYNLSCKNCKNTFDSWFSSSKEYEKLKKLNHINCHECNSLDVEKSLMMPNVVNSEIKNFKNSKKDKHVNIKKKILEYQNFIKKNFNYVGDKFTYEARSMYYNNKKNNKGIYGIASKHDIDELKEEGIETEVIPWIKENDS
tara:strand:+ start:438 stop:866 length:429 start_codon:yes stop_codon:yes gene_type:complete